MNDNSTAHSASEYDQNIRRSIPFYDFFHDSTVNVVKAARIEPSVWIDVGCGTGTLVGKVYDLFPRTTFIVTDPSQAMLEAASKKLGSKDRVRILPPVDAAKLSIGEKADVITAIQSLHYCTPDERKESIQNCRALLRNGGMFITFENIKPLTDYGIALGKEIWEGFEVAAGKTVESAHQHVERFGAEFFPLTIEEYLKLLRDCGFKTVEIIWFAYMQAGFYCVV